jgi:hypothetical protein
MGGHPAGSHAPLASPLREAFVTVRHVSVVLSGAQGGSMRVPALATADADGCPRAPGFIGFAWPRARKLGVDMRGRHIEERLL